MKFLKNLNFHKIRIIFSSRTIRTEIIFILVVNTAQISILKFVHVCLSMIFLQPKMNPWFTWCNAMQPSLCEFESLKTTQHWTTSCQKLLSQLSRSWRSWTSFVRFPKWRSSSRKMRIFTRLKFYIYYFSAKDWATCRRKKNFLKTFCSILSFSGEQEQQHVCNAAFEE